MPPPRCRHCHSCHRRCCHRGGTHRRRYRRQGRRCYHCDHRPPPVVSTSPCNGVLTVTVRLNLCLGDNVRFPPRPTAKMGRHFVDGDVVIDGDVVVDGDSSSPSSLSSWTSRFNRDSSLASRVRDSRAPFVEVAIVTAISSPPLASDAGGGETEMETTMRRRYHPTPPPSGVHTPTMGMDDARDVAVAMEATQNSNMFQWEQGWDVSGIRGVKNKSPLHDSYVTLGTILLL